MVPQIARRRGLAVVSTGFAVLLAGGVFPLCASAEITWETTFTGDYNEEGRAVLEVAPGAGYVVAGHSSSWGPGAPDNTNPFLARFDANGEVLWNQVYGDTRGEAVYGLIREPQDSGYLLCGARANSWSDDDGLLIRTDADGNHVWTRTYGGESTDIILAVARSRSGGYLATGVVTPGPYPTFADAWLLRVDPSGTVLWSRKYGGPYGDTGRAVQELPDGNILLGISTSPDGYDSRLLLIKTDPLGNVIWEHGYTSPNWEYLLSAFQTSDKGFAMLATTPDADGEGDILLVKTDPFGQVRWRKQYDFGRGDNPQAFTQADDGGFLICGYTTSLGLGQQDLHLVRTDELGNMKWTRTHAAGHGRFSDMGYAVRLTSDGGIIAVGLTASEGPGTGVYAVKTDRDGRLLPPGPAGQPKLDAFRAGTGWTVRQNPFAGSTSVPGRAGDRFLLYDIAGRLAGEPTGDRIGGGVPPGVYFLKDPAGPGAALRVVKIQ